MQIALATGLLISAGLFLKSLMNVTHVALGVKVDHVVTFAISPERSGYDSVRSAVLFDRVEQELKSLPGVTGVDGVPGTAPGGRQLGHRCGRAGLPVGSRRG